MSTEDSREQGTPEPPTRKQISKRLRFEIFRRDNFTCRYCGKHAGEDGAELTVDHVTPHTLGGTSDPTNLVTACRDCNVGKSSMPADAAVIADVAQDALRWADAMRRAAELRSQANRDRNRYVNSAQEHWDGFTYGPRGYPVPCPSDSRKSFVNWYNAGLPFQALLDAIEKAMQNQRVSPDQTWRYMCGIAWRTLEEIQTAAKDLLAAEDV